VAKETRRVGGKLSRFLKANAFVAIPGGLCSGRVQS